MLSFSTRFEISCFHFGIATLTDVALCLLSSIAPHQHWSLYANITCFNWLTSFSSSYESNLKPVITIARFYGSDIGPTPLSFWKVGSYQLKASHQYCTLYGSIQVIWWRLSLLPIKVTWNPSSILLVFMVVILVQQNSPFERWTHIDLKPHINTARYLVAMVAHVTLLHGRWHLASGNGNLC